jgi:quercetin dioxygenase-like cupin family protein
MNIRRNMINSKNAINIIAATVNPSDQVCVVSENVVPAVNYEWGAIKWLCDMKVTPGSLQSIGYAYVMPGKQNPEHRHMTCQEVIYMLSGELKLFSNGKWTRLVPGDTALIPQGVRHIVTNEGWEPAVYVASFSAAFRDTIFKGHTGNLALVDHPLTPGEKLY